VSRDDVVSVRARLEAVRAKRLCEGSFSPTSFIILGQLAYGKMLNRTYTAQSNIHWSEDFQTIFFKGRPIEIRKLQEFGMPPDRDFFCKFPCPVEASTRIRLSILYGVPVVNK
jgi:hypothetical protein